ncbi:unnamed protein product [Kuraishia capsulata CBS 1993]|uniref:Uncharacterized protein n=1 Tax=Kuraishia capsulata CBS 1993 TaxID=1382522 RepID=W6MUH6_9ASCO|nr:uncharacterized protein KUCA_T00001600001 [Kuraishia capsulata CBS 1993]CDK25630.1 unnamed protein product [Kuraishia capsulata CBS 1993]
MTVADSHDTFISDEDDDFWYVYKPLILECTPTTCHEQLLTSNLPVHYVLRNLTYLTRTLSHVHVDTKFVSFVTIISDKIRNSTANVLDVVGYTMTPVWSIR